MSGARGTLGNKKKTNRQPSAADLERAKTRVRSIACSEAWVDAVVHGHQPFPPRADNTPMRRCHKCGHIYPGYYVIAAVVCEDCRLAGLDDEFLDSLPPTNLQALLEQVWVRNRRGRFED